MNTLKDHSKTAQSVNAVRNQGAGLDAQLKLNRRLMNAAFAANEEEFKAAVADGADLNLVLDAKKDQKTLLMDLLAYGMLSSSDKGRVQSDLFKWAIEHPSFDPQKHQIGGDFDRYLLKDMVMWGAPLDQIKTVIRKGADIQGNGVSFAMFVLAASLGHADLLRYLIEEHQVNVNQKDDMGFIALEHAAECLFENQGIHYLINAGSDLNSRDDEGQTPLMHAILHQNLFAVEVLLSRGADLSVEDLAGNTAKQWAVHMSDKSPNDPKVNAILKKVQEYYHVAEEHQELTDHIPVPRVASETPSDVTKRKGSTL